MQFQVVTNTGAGNSDGAVDDAVAVLRSTGRVDVNATRDAGDLDRVVDELGDRVLVVVGGDGSLHAALNSLRRRGRLDATVGLVPLGTGNDFARAVDIPLDPADAARSIVTGTPRPHDLIVADDDTVVVNVAHAGLGADAAATAASVKGRLGRMAYPLGALVAGIRTRGWRIDVEVDGTSLVRASRDRVLMVGVANGSSIGGGTPLAPDARPDDGVLDVVVATATGPLARAGFGRRLRTGHHIGRRDVVVARGRSARIAGEPVRHNVDGEVGEPTRAVTYTLEPGAWRLLRP